MAVWKCHVNLIQKQVLGCVVTSNVLKPHLKHLLAFFSCLSRIGFTLVCQDSTLELLKCHQLLAAFLLKEIVSSLVSGSIIWWRGSPACWHWQAGSSIKD